MRLDQRHNFKPFKNLEPTTAKSLPKSNPKEPSKQEIRQSGSFKYKSLAKIIDEVARSSISKTPQKREDKMNLSKSKTFENFNS